MWEIGAKRFIALTAVLFILTGCGTRAKFRSYDKQLDDIRSDVRNIRLITDQMHNELVTLKTSVDVVGVNIDRQTKDIELAKKNQQLLSDSLGNMKDMVVQLEARTLAEKKEELEKLKQEEEDTQITVVTKKEDGVTKIQPLGKPAKEATKPNQRKYATGPEIDTSRTGFGYAVKDGVILWRAPSKNSDVMEILIAWQQVSILGSVKNEGENWLKVKTQDYTGFADSKFIIASE
ncbi:MAG: hypothetical protein AB7F25_00375 [Deferribacterales bacterium]